MILNPINHVSNLRPRFVRAVDKGPYACALVAAATSAPLTERGAWLTGELRFSWRLPQRLAPLVPPAAWAALVDALDAELRRGTQRLWLHLLPCFVGLALSASRLLALRGTRHERRPSAGAHLLRCRPPGTDHGHPGPWT
jgi:hypothetical protein